MVPFFIVGCSRSGTTLLQTLIDCHPNIAIPPESQLYSRFGRVFDTYGDFGVRDHRLWFLRDLLRDVYIRQWHLGARAEDIDRRVLHPTLVGVVEALFGLYAEKKGARHWGDKTPEHIRYLRDIRRDFPQAKLIHLVRDGRDTAEAMRRMIWCPVTAVGLGREWRREVMQWKTFCDECGTAGTLVVHYEDLVTSPNTVLATVLEFIDEPFVDTTASYLDTPLSEALGAQGAWHSSLRRGISSAKVGIYQQMFTPREIEILEATAGDALTTYGYALEHRNPAPPTLSERLHATVADPVVRWWRKLSHLEVVAWDLQFRWRTLYRRARALPMPKQNAHVAG